MPGVHVVDKRLANTALPLAVVLAVVTAVDVVACWWTLSLDVLTPLSRALVASNFPVVILSAVAAAHLFRKVHDSGGTSGGKDDRGTGRANGRRSRTPG